MIGSGSFAERLRSAWTEMRDNPGRTSLQTLGVLLGVASVLGGMSISDSQRRRADELFVKMGGLDKLNVQPNGSAPSRPTALEAANLGLRNEDAAEGLAAGEAPRGVSMQKLTRARVRSPFADQERRVVGVAGDWFAIEGYEAAEGRLIGPADVANAAPVAVLGSEAASTLFPTGGAVGTVIRVGDTPVMVIGVLDERVFRFRDNQRNMFRRRNRVVAVPSTLLSRRIAGDPHARVDRITFKIPEVSAIEPFTKVLGAVLRGNHRQQDDFRLDDVHARMERQRSQGDVYNVIFLLSGVLALIGGGMVNVNVQLASLKDRVREVGVRMAIGASGREIFLEFLTEAFLLTLVGAGAGLLAGVAFAKTITSAIRIPLYMSPASFGVAFALALVFGFLFALYPAWRASRLSPMEALRYE